ncbi:MAG: hypothetical protein IJ141_06655 [Lachnospiraceae bacterium]|nr:hypothetical protein [Lachnospiraceae bacterium]
MEKFTAAQIKKLEELMAKKERIEKRDKEFFKEVRSRRDEVLEALQIEQPAAAPINEDEKVIVDTVLSVAEKCDCDVTVLLNLMTDTRQIEYWRRQILPPASAAVE